MSSKSTTNTLRKIISFLYFNPSSKYSTIRSGCVVGKSLSDGLSFLQTNGLIESRKERGIDYYSLSNHTNKILYGNKKAVWIIVQNLDNKKRVRLADGSLTPAFEYSKQAFVYAESKGIVNCDIVKV